MTRQTEVTSRGLHPLIMKKLYIIPLLLMLSIIPYASTYAAQVYWGGVSFSDWQNKEQHYPNVASFLCADDCGEDNLNSWALSGLNSSTFDKFNVSLDYINGSQIEGVIMTPMIYSEATSVYKDITEGKISYIHVYRIYASLMFFEFGSKRFINSKPVVVQYTDTLKAPATDEQKRQTFEKLLNPDDNGVNLFAELFKSGKKINPMSFSQKYVRVSKLGISEVAMNNIDLENSDSWLISATRQLEAYIVEKTGAPVVPSASSDEVTGEIAATFANASVKIRLPAEVPFNVGAIVKNFKKIEKPNRRQKTLCHAVGLDFRIDGPFESLVKGRFTRTVDSCAVVSRDKEVDDAFYFTNSLYSLLSDLSAQLKPKPDPSFFKKSNKSNKNHARDFSKAWQTAFKSEF